MHDDDAPTTKPPTGPVAPRRGYKAPPVEHQFRRGRSGNPHGRPKGSKGKKQVAEKVLLETHRVVDGGREVELTVLDLVVIALRNKACEGDNLAFKELEKLAARYDPQPPAQRAGYLVVPGRLTMEAWRARFERKNDPTQPEDEE